MSKSKFPNTPFQRWLAKNGACAEGRGRVGNMTLLQYWKKCEVHSDLDWLTWRILKNAYGGENLSIHSADFTKYEEVLDTMDRRSFTDADDFRAHVRRLDLRASRKQIGKSLLKRGVR